jgi:hypothetical protein
MFALQCKGWTGWSGAPILLSIHFSTSWNHWGFSMGNKIKRTAFVAPEGIGGEYTKLAENRGTASA